LDVGLEETAKAAAFNKESALRDLQALTTALDELPKRAAEGVDAIGAELDKLDSDPALSVALRRSAFIETGVRFIDGPACPLCDTAWASEAALKEHLEAKLLKAAEARTIQATLLTSGAIVAAPVDRVIATLGPVQRLLKDQKSDTFEQLVTEWKGGLSEVRGKLGTIDGLLGLRDAQSGDKLHTPPALSDGLQGLVSRIQAQPDQSTTANAQTFLTTAQLRLDDYRDARRKEAAAQASLATAN
jgi:hypothetical protein